MGSRPLPQCLACEGTTLLPYLDLGVQPLANGFHHGEPPLSYPLSVVYCPHCSHSQLTVSVDPTEMFTHYKYVSGTSATLRAHFEGFVQQLLARWTEARPPRILEIASNDGTLLGLLKDAGAEVHGIDPAENLVALCQEKGLPVERAYWNLETAASFGETFDFVVAMNVLPHVPDPCVFLQACRQVLAPGGKLCIQTSQCDMFLNSEFDAIYHEHCSYFTAHSFCTLAHRAGLTPISGEKVDIHSRSFRVWLSANSTPTAALDALLHEEVGQEVFSEARYLRFGLQAQQCLEALREMVAKARCEGERVIGYGAAAKGNTVLNAARIDLDYIVDDNPLKRGYLTPGRNIPVVSLHHLEAESETVTILLLAWNFASEIITRLRSIRPAGDRLIRYFPTVEITTL